MEHVVVVAHAVEDQHRSRRIELEREREVAGGDRPEHVRSCGNAVRADHVGCVDAIDPRRSKRMM